MFGIGGFNPVNLLATAAFGPLGGLVAQLAEQVLSQLGQNILQQLGQQLGLPQGVIDDAKGSFVDQFTGGQQGGQFGGVQQGGGSSQDLFDAIKDYGEANGASPQQIGEAQGAVDDILTQGINDIGGSQEAQDAKSGGKGGSWLLAIARALGDKANKLADKMSAQAENLDTGKPKESAEFQATSQQFNMLMNALTNSIKTIGEALGNTARKN